MKRFFDHNHVTQGHLNTNDLSNLQIIAVQVPQIKRIQVGVAIAKQAADPVTGVALIHTVVPSAAAVGQLVSPASLRPHCQSTAPA